MSLRREKIMVSFKQMFRLVKYLRGYMVKTVLGPLLKLTEAIFELFTPIVVAWIIDTAIPMGKAGDFSGLVYGGLIILALGVFGLGFALTAQYFASRASMGFGTNVRRALFHKVNSLSAADIDRFGSSSLITRLTTDVVRSEQAVAMFIRLVTRAPFIAVGATVMAMFIDVKTAVIFLAAGLMVAVLLSAIMTSTLPRYKRVQSGLDRITELTNESLAGARVIRAFGAEERVKENFGKASDDLCSASVRAGAMSMLLNPLVYAVVNLAIVAILYFGGKRVYYGALSQGQIIALVNYLMQILNALVVLANLIVTFTKASASAARINEVLDSGVSLTEGKGAQPDFAAPAVELCGVSFAYAPDAPDALSDINLTVKSGMRVGILGGTGSGKSTLINLIPRLYDVKTGEVSVFGRDVRDYTDDELRALVAAVPQRPMLFSGTVRDNMRWGKEDATDEEITAALRDAQADFALTGKDGLNGEIAEGGKNLSGGQRQRLTVARALVPGAKILLLDDSSSALDFATDARMRRALRARAEREGMTVVTVSQRVGSIMDCDVIVVMDEGRIAGAGTHEELLSSCPAYREIYASQTREGA